uniref:ATP synthase CF0 B subunit n=2 Tax=Pseudotsuga TaxID=3356 RepID=A0A346LZE4_9CONI|nr:ATP synthase CF0 B subunit [Pseudotsuga brevifolia]YP_010204442.1 CF0 subunit I [Pseudotsuga sinensis]AXQ02066.1 ATP synthase CF0 B subunit [Pseudotsuga menziesii var. glauca]AXQ02139.1 ATP synthase CF0 B subunit [Pseudotsuga macrocarpa]BDI62971.1 ATP synthase CF0 B chain [Pseudotsuga sinensis var. wilsoniana]QVH34601.1 ATP synthase CF0 B subunit [Pseudotsuga brevifolia]UAV84867.1 CF0 subunit I [Pseudotsuga sinensis]
MKNVIDPFISLSYWPSAGGFGSNTNILETNIINPSVVLSVLIYFGKGVLSNLLDNRKQKILNTIQNSEELCKGAIDQLEKARARLREVEMIAGEIRVNGDSQIEREKEDLINAASDNLEQLEDPKNETVYSEQQRVIDQIRQQVSRQALRRAIGTLNSRLNTELHLRTIDHNIGLLRAMMNTND